MYYTEPRYLTQRLKIARNYRQLVRDRKHNRLMTALQIVNITMSVLVILCLWSIGLKELNFGIIVVSLLVGIKLHDWRIR